LAAVLAEQRTPLPVAELPAERKTSNFVNRRTCVNLWVRRLSVCANLIKWLALNIEMPDYFAIQWHITDVCDQRCKHCYIFSEGHPCLISTPWEELVATFEQIKTFCTKINRTPYIYLTGGDPILHPDFWRLLDVFKRDNVRFCIMGNPFHLTPDVCKKMKEAGCVKYQLSLDGLEQTHDMFRKKGSFLTTLEKIKVIKDAGMWCAVMTTVSKVNMNEIPALIDLVDSLGVDVYAVGRYCPTSVQKAYDAAVHIPPQEYRAFLDKCWQTYQKHKDSKTTFQLKDHLWALYLYEEGLYKPECNGEISDGCNCGRNHLTILPTGDVYACRRMESKVGNVNEDDLYKLWTGDAFNAYRQYDKFTKCSKCNLLGVCRGCPAVTFGYTGSMYDPDPQCWKEV
jgi:radical SAM/SPASM domain protein of ACGX system